MPDVRVYRNDGAALFADDPGSLEYIDPGVVLLYADTEAGVVCSYFEGRLGQPIQGTVECTFADGIDLSRVRPALEAVDEPGFSVSDAPTKDATSARWALDGVTEEQIWLADPQRDAVRRLVDTDDEDSDRGRDWLPGRPFGGFDWSLGDLVDARLLPDQDDSGDGSGGDSDGNGDDGEASTDDNAEGVAPAVRADGPPAPSGGATLDFETRSTYDAARFFAFLVDELADTGLTVAVSKAGRVDAVADADVVIQPDGDLPPGSRVAPLPETSERLDVQTQAVARERALDHLDEPVAALAEAFEETRADEAVDDDTGEAVLRDVLDAQLGAYSSLAVVDRWRARYRRVRVAAIALLVGVLAGVIGADPIRLAGWHVETAARDLATTDPGVVRAAALDAVGGASTLAVPATAGLVLVAAIVARRRRRNDDRDRDHRPSTARSDLRRIALTAVVVAALLALAASGVLLWIGT